MIAWGLGLTVIGLIIGWLGHRWARSTNALRIAAQTWPAVPVTIIKAKVFAGEDDWGIKAHYRYTIDGREFRSSRVRYGGESYATREAAQAELDRLGARPGATVPAYYDPARPRRAVLAREGGQPVNPVVTVLVLVAFYAGIVAPAYATLFG